MKLRTALFATSLPALFVLAGFSFARQDKDKPVQGTPAEASGKKDDLQGMEMPKPTKEHEWLKGRVGTWDCVVNCPVMGGPSKATETTESFGDFWVVSKFEGAFMGSPFKGIGLTTYDPMKKKYVGSWCDTMTPSLFVMEGTTDAAGTKLTSIGKGPNMEGVVVEYTHILETKGPDAALFTMYETAKGPSAPDAMTIEYKRRK